MFDYRNKERVFFFMHNRRGCAKRKVCQPSKESKSLRIPRVILSYRAGTSEHNKIMRGGAYNESN